MQESISEMLKISIHAPRMGSDIMRRKILSIFTYFNPRSPHGERPPETTQKRKSIKFQSTLPAWGATLGYTIEWIKK